MQLTTDQNMQVYECDRWWTLAMTFNLLLILVTIKILIGRLSAIFNLVYCLETDSHYDVKQQQTKNFGLNALA